MPGESYLELLDGLYESPIRLITCRHEASAANMAEAYGKLTGRPGVCMVTRGPGATQASVGVHTAFQDSTPLILLVGQVASSQEEREAFQEVDYRRMFGPLEQVGGADRPRRADPRVHGARVHDRLRRASGPGRARAARGHARGVERRRRRAAVPGHPAQPGSGGSRVARRAARVGRAAVRDHRRRGLDAGRLRRPARVPRGQLAADRRGVPAPGLTRQRLARVRG